MRTQILILTTAIVEFLCTCPESFASPFPVGGEIYVTSVNLSEPVTIKANFDDWETELFEPGNRLYSKQVARIGMSINHFQLGYSKQLYYFLNFSSDTARLHYLERNGDADQEKGVYNIRLDANNAEAEGMYLGYTFSWKDLRVNTILTYLNLQDLYYGQASGTFDPAVTTDNDTNILIDYAYPEDKIFEREVAAPQGNGLTLDISASYQWHNHEINLDIGEAFSDLYWNTAPGSRIEGNINRLTSSDEATVRFSHFRTRFHQRLPVHTQASYRYQFHTRFGAGVNYEKLDTKEWLKWAADWHIDEQWTGSLLWSAEDDLVGFELSHPNFLFALESDDTDYRKSHYLKLQLVARLLF